MNADKRSNVLGPDDEYVELAVEVFSMLADATRVRLVLALRDGERSVSELAAAVGKPGPATSQHLAKLRLAHIVVTRQEGTKVFYRLANEHARQLVADAVFQAEHSLGGTPRHHETPRQAAAQRAAPRQAAPRQAAPQKTAPRQAARRQATQQRADPKPESR